MALACVGLVLAVGATMRVGVVGLQGLRGVVSGLAFSRVSLQVSSALLPLVAGAVW